MVSILVINGTSAVIVIVFLHPGENQLQSQTYKKLSFTNPLIRSNLLLLFTCSLAVLPVCVRSIFPPTEATKLEARPRGSQSQRTTPTCFTQSTLVHLLYCTSTPLFVDLFCFGLFVLFVLFSFQGLCQSWFEISLRPNMSHTTGHVGHWEDLETWLSIATDSLLLRLLKH